MHPDRRRLELCLVENDAGIRDELRDAFLEAGFGVRAFPASTHLYSALLEAPCDIAILDTNLPVEDGFSIAARLRSLGKTGIIMLSSSTDVEDRVRSLQSGADVCLMKPVDLRELVAVVGSLARRMALAASEGTRDAAGGPDSWSLSADSWAVVAPNGTALPLTAQERAVLKRLWESADESVAREELVIALGADPYDYDFHRLDTLVSRLRRKAADINLTLPIRAVRGTGYAITPGRAPPR